MIRARLKPGGVMLVNDALISFGVAGVMFECKLIERGLVKLGYLYYPTDRFWAHESSLIFRVPCGQLRL